MYGIAYHIRNSGLLKFKPSFMVVEIQPFKFCYLQKTVCDNSVMTYIENYRFLYFKTSLKEKCK
jgi:hypothetical protein